MSGAAQAGVVSPDGYFHPVKHTFGYFRLSRDIFICYPAHGLIVGLVVIGGGDNEVSHGHLIVFVNPVMMKECAAWRLDQAHSLQLFFTFFDELAAGDILVIKQIFNYLGGMEKFNQAGPVAVKGHIIGLTAGISFINFKFLLGSGAGNIIAGIESGNWSNPVPAFFFPQFFR